MAGGNSILQASISAEVEPNMEKQRTGEVRTLNRSDDKKRRHDQPLSKGRGVEEQMADRQASAHKCYEARSKVGNDCGDVVSMSEAGCRQVCRSNPEQTGMRKLLARPRRTDKGAWYGKAERAKGAGKWLRA